MKKDRFTSKIWALALNVWIEAVRDRLLILLTGSGICLMVFSLILGNLAVGGQERVVQNMGFWILGMWGLLAVMYLGSNIVRQEIRQKTIYLVLSRPVTRPAFLTGKFFGMLLVLFSIFCILAVFWLILIYFMRIPVTALHVVALVFIFGEWVLLAGFSLFFASFTSPLLHNFFIAGIAFLGHWSNDLRAFAENTEELWLKSLLKAIYYILPNLEAMNFREAALYNNDIGSALLIKGASVLLCWIITVLLAANVIFMHRRLL